MNGRGEVVGRQTETDLVLTLYLIKANVVLLAKNVVYTIHRHSWCLIDLCFVET